MFVAVAHVRIAVLTEEFVAGSCLLALSLVLLVLLVGVVCYPGYDRVDEDAHYRG